MKGLKWWQMQLHFSFICIRNLSNITKEEVNVQLHPISVLLNCLLIYSDIQHGERLYLPQDFDNLFSPCSRTQQLLTLNFPICKMETINSAVTTARGWCVRIQWQWSINTFCKVHIVCTRTCQPKSPIYIYIYKKPYKIYTYIHIYTHKFLYILCI